MVMPLLLMIASLYFYKRYQHWRARRSPFRAAFLRLPESSLRRRTRTLAWYTKFYAGLGWSSAKPITAMGRTMTGFQGKDAKVDMTLMDREEGKTFVALALSSK